jgi:hypothetical protein
MIHDIVVALHSLAAAAEVVNVGARHGGGFWIFWIALGQVYNIMSS